MAFHYLIDGYNLLYALPEMPSGSWEEKRAKLLAFIEERRPQGNNPATVVFDSREGWGNRSQQGSLTVLFTAGETADDKISAMVREAPNPRSLVVVSNDQGLRTLVRGTGVRFLTVPEFLKASPSPTQHRGSQSERPAPDPDITDELKKKWL